ncbi:hypothetical protein GRI97_12100 [Altererythrobacter xixiisoli]|uniref:Transferrin-binding protein B C-lobe/N-lobe beta barrel domain-containing protein n=1 Tax=Croceibacterium xixiisoli TaxID=1476466 RepID=A0A6I4TV91_9SPHN|nr:hypothetical protein [Croceibacterium xixiisoli]MXO99732.1 hypothetical protein [Croceibacterium xixiisoli]
MNRAKLLTFAASTVILASCGNDDKPTPAPTPPPAGAPTPTPSTPRPSPTPTYVKVSDLTADRTFASACAIPSLGSSSPPFFTSLSGKPNLSYSATTKSWTFHETDLDNIFIESDKVNPQHLFFRKPLTPVAGSFSESFSFGYTGANTTEYVTPADFIRSFASGGQRVYSCLAGSPTQASDMPIRNESAYSAVNLVGGGSILEPGAQILNLRFDPTISTFAATFDAAAGQLRITLDIKARNSFDFNQTGPITDIGIFTGSVEVDTANQRFEGYLKNDEFGDHAVSLSGWFFGPQAAEMGFNFASSASNGLKSIGVSGKMLAKR